jgi:hypothetical protein
MHTYTHAILHAGYDDGQIALMKMTNHMVDHTEQAHTAEISGAEFSKDARKLATCGHDRVALVYEISYYSESPRSKEVCMYVCMYVCRSSPASQGVRMYVCIYMYIYIYIYIYAGLILVLRE